MPTTTFASLPRMKKHRRIDGYIVCFTTSGNFSLFFTKPSGCLTHFLI